MASYAFVDARPGARASSSSSAFSRSLQLRLVGLRVVRAGGADPARCGRAPAGSCRRDVLQRLEAREELRELLVADLQLLLRLHQRVRVEHALDLGRRHARRLGAAAAVGRPVRAARPARVWRRRRTGRRQREHAATIAHSRFMHRRSCARPRQFFLQQPPQLAQLAVAQVRDRVLGAAARRQPRLARRLEVHLVGQARPRASSDGIVGGADVASAARRPRRVVGQDRRRDGAATGAGACARGTSTTATSSRDGGARTRTRERLATEASPRARTPTEREPVSASVCRDRVAHARRQMIPEQRRRLGHVDVARGRQHRAQIAQLRAARLAAGQMRRRRLGPRAFREVDELRRCSGA